MVQRINHEPNPTFAYVTQEGYYAFFVHLISYELLTDKSTSLPRWAVQCATKNNQLLRI